MTIREKIDSLFKIKKDIRESVIKKGGSIPEDNRSQIFSKFGDYIRQIKAVVRVSKVLKYNSFGYSKTYFNAPDGETWDSVEVQFGNALFDLTPSLVSSGSTVFGVNGGAFTRIAADINALYSTEHWSEYSHILYEGHLLTTTQYPVVYYEGLFILNSDAWKKFIFCMRNFYVQECDLVSRAFKPKGCIIVTHNKSDDTYAVERNFNNQVSSQTLFIDSIVYASRYLMYKHFTEGQNFPVQLYPKPFSIRINPSYLKSGTQKIGINFAGNALQIHFRSAGNASMYNTYQVHPLHDHTVHEYLIPVSYISSLKDYGEIDVIFTGHITGLIEFADKETTQGLFTLATSITSPFPAEITTARGLFCNSKISSIPLNLFQNCKNRISGVDKMFSGTLITQTPGGLFEDCTRITTFEYLYAECPNLTHISPTTFKTKGSVTSIKAAFRRCDITYMGDFLEPISSTIEDISYLFSRYGDVAPVATTGTNRSFKISLSPMPKLKNASYLFFRSDRVSNLEFHTTGTPLLENLEAIFYSCENLRTATLKIETSSQAVNLHSICENNTKLTTFTASIPATCRVVNCDYAFYFDDKLTYCPPWWSDVATKNASHNGCFYMCFSASNYAAARDSGWATLTTIGS